MRIKTILLSILFLSTSSVLAETVQTANTLVKIEGLLNFQTGFINQSNLTTDEKNISPNQKHFAFYTDAIIVVQAEQTVGEITYGGKITLLPTTRLKTSASYNGSHIYIKSEFGKVELGSQHDAGSKIRITAEEVTAGGDWGKYANLGGTKMEYKGMTPEFVDYSEYFLDGVYRTKLDQINDRAEPARKISYFTPTFKGFKFGISYTPDSANTGGTVFNKISAGKQEINVNEENLTIEINRNVKNAFSGGVSYEHNITDGVDFKMSLSGEYGKAAGGYKMIANKDKDDEATLKEGILSDLKTFNIGTVFTYGNFSYGASYGNLGKSLTNKDYNKTSRETHYYNAAIGYGQGPIKASFSFFKANQFKNELESLTLASELKWLPGLTPYGEVSIFQARGRPSFYPEAPKKKTRGTVALLGAKLKL